VTVITQVIHVTRVATVTEVLKTSCTNEDTSYVLRDLLPNPDDVPVGAIWTNENNVGGFTNGTTFNAFHIEAGTYTFSYTITTGTCPRRIEIKMTVNTDCGVLPCESIVIHNAFTPNGDTINDFFEISHIEDFDCYPTNSVEIYNRWGVLVYETKNYDNGSKKFEGISEGRATLSKSEELPTGTYFYIIQWTTSDGQTVNKDGYLYLTR
jgi:gliding motility-associated-like protein